MKSAANPLEARRRRKHLKRWKIWGMVFLLFFLISVLIYLVFFSDFFRLTNMEISGFSEKSDTIKLQAEQFLSDSSYRHFWPAFVSRYLKQKSASDSFINFDDQNMIFFDSQELKNLIKQDFPDYKNISVSLNWAAQKLLISAEIRQSVLTWCLKSKNDCYYLDQDGIAFASAPETTGYLFIAVLDENDTPVVLGDQMLNKESVDFIKKTADLLAQNGWEIKQLVVQGSNPDTAKIYFSSWYAQVSLSSQPEQILEMMEKLKTEKIKENFPSLEYMDLRYPNRIYYKLK